MIINQTSQRNSKEGMEDDPDPEKEPAVSAGTAVGAPRTHGQVSPASAGHRTPRHRQGVRRPAGQVGLPEGEPDRCNPAELVEGDIPG